MIVQFFQQGLQGVQDFISQAPFGIKLLTIITLNVYLINFLFKDIFSIYFMDFPFKVLYKYQIWRLFFTQFIEQKLGLILVPYFMCKNLSDVEKNLGTVVFLIDFFFKSFMIQVFLLSNQVIFLIISIITNKIYIPSFGLWNVYFVFVSLECFKNPDSFRTIFLCPCIFSAKYTPYFLFIFGQLISQSYDITAAFILLCVETYFFNYMILRPSQQFIQKLENSFLFRCFKSRSDFFIMTQNLQVNSSYQSELPVQHFQEFSGKGIQIGGTLNFDTIETINNYQYQEVDKQQSQQSK
ncbi:unnamed protein product [Paramecium pentaurelia]|uniref:Transmembrane protein n=1 Tax=Paramecium pentaurelia TaxID=43138 RepID=A0A8S1X5Z9_9CILI|nr:unnamed protein product [Paramecium pentaurelia]